MSRLPVPSKALVIAASGALTLVLLLTFSACEIHNCKTHEDCKNNFLCGPYRMCLEQCHGDGRGECREGFRCADDGLGCVKGDLEDAEKAADGGPENDSGGSVDSLPEAPSGSG